MNKPKILDCTIRDGGYYTNWDFDNTLIQVYCKLMEQLPVEYVEVGYRSIPLKGYTGKYFYCPEYIMKELKELMPSKKLAIILNEKDIRVQHLPELLEPCISYITMVRIAIDPKNFERAINLAIEIKKMGFEVAFNVMYMSDWKSDSDFLRSLPKLDGLVDYFYMVDSFGGIMTEDVQEIISLVKKESGEISLGFHGHDNLQMALANSLTAINSGCDIIDCTITGMGRGAGNLRTELLLTYLDSKTDIKLDYGMLSYVVSEFEELKNHYKWGTNLPYMFSGAYSLSQKQVMEWVGLNRYSISSILNALHNQKELIEDNLNLPLLSVNKDVKKVVIVGGGSSFVQHNTALFKYLANNPEICLLHAGARYVKDCLEINNKQYYALVGSESDKLNDSIEDLDVIKGQCVYPPFPRVMGTIMPNELQSKSVELKEISFIDKYHDSPLVISIQIALDLGATDISFFGFDGYEDPINRNQLLITQENQNVFDIINSMDQLSVNALIPTKYRNVEHCSIYGLIQ